MYLRSLVLVLVISGCGGSTVVQEPSHLVVEKDKSPSRQWMLSGEPSAVYVGDSIRHRDARIEVAPLAAMPGSGLSDKESKHWHLVRVNGEDEELDGKVFLAQWKPYSEGLAFIATIKGQPRNMLYSPERQQETWEFHGQEGPPWPLVVDSDAPELGEELLRQYHQQVDSGMQEKLAPSTRAGREKAQESKLNATRATLQAACNINTLAIDWSTVEDGLMNKYSIAGRCTSDVSTVVSFCKSYPNAKERLKEISKVRCDFSSQTTAKNDLVVEGNELVYYTRRNDASFKRNSQWILMKAFGELDQVLEGAKSTMIVRFGRKRRTVYYEIDDRLYPIGYNLNVNDGIALTRGIGQAYLVKKEQQWELRCGIKSPLPLTRVIGEKRAQLLAKATFEKEEKWKRETYFLARDTRGVYYYVDRYKKNFGGRRYRVFIGKRGMLQLTKLKGVVEDSEGTVFSTEKGDLRLIVNPSSALWIRGKKRSELTPVDPLRNRKLIFDELGVYLGENLGHVCDE